MPVVRSWVGTSESDESINERYDRLGTVDETIIESLRSQIAAMTLDAPAQLTDSSGFSVNYSANITALNKTLNDFINRGGTDGLPDEEAAPNSMIKMVRNDLR